MIHYDTMCIDASETSEKIDKYISFQGENDNIFLIVSQLKLLRVPL